VYRVKGLGLEHQAERHPKGRSKSTIRRRRSTVVADRDRNVIVVRRATDFTRNRTFGRMRRPRNPTNTYPGHHEERDAGIARSRSRDKSSPFERLRPPSPSAARGRPPSPQEGAGQQARDEDRLEYSRTHASSTSEDGDENEEDFEDPGPGVAKGLGPPRPARSGSLSLLRSGSRRSTGPCRRHGGFVVRRERPHMFRRPNTANIGHRLRFADPLTRSRRRFRDSRMETVGERDPGTADASRRMKRRFCRLWPPV